MGFASIRELTDAYDAGRVWTSTIYKSGSPVPNGAGRLIDLSMVAGQPRYNAYVGTQYEATPLIGSANYGINTGPTTPVGMAKYLTDFSLYGLATSIPWYVHLCDYLMFYPLIDLDSLDEQILDPVATLPRYANGEGVRLALIASVPVTTTTTCTFEYTNSDGVGGRVSSCGLASANLGVSVVTPSAFTAQIPFVPLANGDRGVRSVEKVTLSASAGGFANLVLVKPLLNMQMPTSGLMTEKSPLLHINSMPRIYDGAYLQMMAAVSNTTSTASIGSATFAWG